MSTKPHDTPANEASVAPFSVGLLDRETYLAFRRVFKHFAKVKILSPGSMALRAILLGRPLKKSFAPISNPRKLANGQAEWGGLERALSVGALNFAAGVKHAAMTDEEKKLFDRIIKPVSPDGLSLLEIARRQALADLVSPTPSTHLATPPAGVSR